MVEKVSISLCNVSKVYKRYHRPADRLKEILLPGKSRAEEFWAIRNINLEIPKGETIGIIGRNGSGKSTLLQIIAGTLQPTAGEVQVNGRVSALLELGSGFNPEFTGRQNVFFNGRILGLSQKEIESKFDGIAAFADIGEFIDQPVKTYSSGMFVRLAFAVAINVRPDILIIDEALSVGDYSFQQKCFRQISDMQSLGTSILFVSHDLSSTIQYCDRAIMLSHGELLAEGLPANIVGEYKKMLTFDSKSTKSTSTSDNYVKIDGSGKKLKDFFVKNPNCKEYGGDSACILDWGILNTQGKPLSVINSDEMIEIRIRTRFLDSCDRPIVGFFLTDLKGREIVGTNTKYEGYDLNPTKDGDEFIVSFKQNLGIASGVYSLNIGCSEYIEDQLVAHHRIYDVTLLEIFSSKELVGFCYLRTDVSIQRVTN